MHIENTIVNNCDWESQVYCKSFNKFSSILDLVSTNEMNDYDLSALGLYLCKCIEQELNSSVVQLMRYYLGIDMPDFYCKRDPNFIGESGVDTSSYGTTRHLIYLNNYVDYKDPYSLKMIPMGDAFHALKVLIKENRKWFEKYPVVLDLRFAELWRDISKLRNEIAHPGLIVNRTTLLTCYDRCVQFLKNYMPSLAKLKNGLAPKGWVDDRQTEFVIPAKKIDLPSVDELMSGFQSSGKPKATPENYKILMELREKVGMAGVPDEIMTLGQKAIDYEQSYDWFEMPFIEDGMVGVKDILGQTVIPARYDAVMELHNMVSCFYSTTIIRKNNQYGIVERYSGKELTPCVYDKLFNMYDDYWDFLFFQKDGTDCFGIVRRDGKEVVPCIIDNLKATKGERQNLIFKSGDKYGLYSYAYDVCIDPIFDDILPSEKDYKPYVFMVYGQEGYMSKDSKFIPVKKYKQMKEGDENYVDKKDLIADFDEYD